MAFTIPTVPANVVIAAHEIVLENRGSRRDAHMAVIVKLADKYDHNHICDALMRLRALSELIERTKKSAWIADTADKDCKIVNEAMFRAAARAPLIEERRQLKFDTKQFMQIALEESDVEGSA
jgi:hypothetical protein